MHKFHFNSPFIIFHSIFTNNFPMELILFIYFFLVGHFFIQMYINKLDKKKENGKNEDVAVYSAFFSLETKSQLFLNEK